MSEQRWTAYNSVVTYLTALDSVSNNGAVLGAAIDFEATGVDRKQYIALELNMMSHDWSAQTNPYVPVWVLPRTDETNFEYGSTGNVPTRQPDAVFTFAEINGAQRLFIPRMLTTPDQAKIIIQNLTGVGWSVPGSTLKYRIFGEETV